MKVLAERFASKFSAIIFIISVITAWMIPPETGFPMVAFFVLFTGFSSLVYFVRLHKTWFDTMLYFGILLLSFFTLYRANEVLQFLDFLFIIFFMSLLIRPLIRESGVFSILLSPLLVIKDAYTAKNKFPYNFKVPEVYAKRTHVRDYVPTLFVTVLLLLITIPLLASANPFFNTLLQNVINFFNLEWLFKLLASDRPIEYILRLIAAVTLLYCLPRILTSTTEEVKTHFTKHFFAINYLIPKVTMAVLLIIFFITQLQLYFASPQILQSMGYTNSRLTNEVFAQVTIVAFIVFLLAYFDKSRKKWNKALTYFLIVEAFFLVGIAFKSVYDYSSLYGFTEKRLWGYTTMTWLTCALTAFVYHYKKQTENLSFIKQILTLSLGVMLLVNVLNYDYLIYRYAKPTIPGGIDYNYLSKLSPDAHQYKEILNKALSENESTPVNTILDKIEFLRYKYEKKKTINAFNIAEYQEYLDTKDITITDYRTKGRQVHD